MSRFKLPNATCVKLTSAMLDFWWNSKEEKKEDSLDELGEALPS